MLRLYHIPGVYDILAGPPDAVTDEKCSPTRTPNIRVKEMFQLHSCFHAIHQLSCHPCVITETPSPKLASRLRTLALESLLELRGIVHGALSCESVHCLPPRCLASHHPEGAHVTHQNPCPLRRVWVPIDSLHRLRHRTLSTPPIPITDEEQLLRREVL
jgi:hypothetical protein